MAPVEDQWAYALVSAFNLGFFRKCWVRRYRRLSSVVLLAKKWFGTPFTLFREESVVVYPSDSNLVGFCILLDRNSLTVVDDAVLLPTLGFPQVDCVLKCEVLLSGAHKAF